MHISWHGLSCIKIQTADCILLINPYQNTFGVQMPKFKVNAAASTDSSNDQANNFDSLQGEPFILSTAGEFEVNGLFITGVQYNGGQVMYVVETENITLAHLGTSSSQLGDDQLEVLEGVDVLFLPLTCEKKDTCGVLVSQIEPRMIIPIQYKTAKFKADLVTLDAFAKEMGLKDTHGVEKIILKAKDLPVEETAVTILTPA